MEIKEALRNVFDNVVDTHPQDVWNDTIAAVKELHDEGYLVKIGVDKNGDRWQLNRAASVVYSVILMSIFGAILLLSGASIVMRAVLKWLRLALTVVLTLCMLVPGILILFTLLVTDHNGPTKLGKKFGRKVQ